MAVDSRHPSYTAMLPIWQRVDDCYEGQDRIKEKGPDYLKPTGGMVANGYGKVLGSIGAADYDSYLARAVYHDFFTQAVIGLTSIVHRKKGTIVVPPVMDELLKNITLEGEDIWQLWRRITMSQLKDGRVGALADVPTGPEAAEPFVALYSATCVINWAEKVRVAGRKTLSLVVLDEATYEMGDDYAWTRVQRYLLLALSVAVDEAGVQVGKPVYRSQMVTMNEGGGGVDPEAWVEVSLAGTKLERIPFVFINHGDIVPEPSSPPLRGLADLTITIYIGEADYRRALFMQGQDTLVLIGRTDEQKEIAVGAGAAIEMPMGGDAKFIGVSADGLGTMKEQVAADKAQASTYSVQLLDTKGGDAESGEALRIRVSARTSTIASMQWTAAGGILEILRAIARLKGLSEDVVAGIVVTPNLDFVDEGADASEVSLLMTAKSLGLPLLDEDIHEWLKKHEYTSKSWEDVKKGLELEQQDRAQGRLPDPGAGGGGFGGGGGF